MIQQNPGFSLNLPHGLIKSDLQSHTEDSLDTYSDQLANNFGTTEAQMKRTLASLTIMAIVMFLLTPICVARSNSSSVLKQQERYTLSLELEFTKKEQNPLEHAISVLFDVGPNGYATGFLVGNGLVMTAYHVISRQLE